MTKIKPGVPLRTTLRTSCGCLSRQIAHKNTCGERSVFGNEKCRCSYYWSGFTTMKIALPTRKSDWQLLGKSFAQWRFPCARGSWMRAYTKLFIQLFIISDTTSANKHCRDSSLVIYHEAARHGSTKSGCCLRFCLRSKLLLWHNPGAEGQWKQREV